MDSRCASCVCAYSSNCDRGNVCDVMANNSTGASAGFTLRSIGGVGMPGGSWYCAAEMADCTSCAAASMFRLNSKVKVMLVTSDELDEFIASTPGIVDSCASSGVATADAMTSGEAPGKLAVRRMVGS